MAKLLLTIDGVVVRDFPLDSERLTIGRAPDNGVQLNDTTVSARHAAIFRLQNYYVEDLGSTNGTMVNGKTIQRRMLQHGDVIRVGRHELRFEQAQDMDLSRTVIIPPEQVPGAPLPPLPLGTLQVLSGPRKGELLELGKPFTTVGEPGVQVAVIARRAQGYFLTRVGGGIGRTPPKVNGLELGTMSHRLQDGDQVEIAGAMLEFCLRAEGEVSAR